MRARVLSAVVLLAACPSGPTEVRPGPPKPALADPALAALAMAPAQTAYFISVRRLSAVAEGARTVLDTLRTLDAKLNSEALDQAFRKELGASPLQSIELEDAGLDPSADAALFSNGISPTFAIKIGDEARLTKFLGERTKSLTTYVRSHRGVAVTSWNPQPGVRGSFLRLRGYLLLHLELQEPAPAAARPPAAPPAKAVPDRSDAALPWLDEIVAAAEAGRGPNGLEWALAAAGDRREVVLFADPGRIARAAAATARNRAPSCSEGDAELARIGRLAVGVAFRAREAKLALQAELTPAARKELAAAVTDGPRLPGALWDAAPARAEWQIDPIAVAAWLRRIGQPRCGPLQSLLSGLSGLAEPIEQNRAALEHAGRSGSAALLAADEKGQGTLFLRGAVIGRVPGPADRSYLERQLPLSPGEEKITGKMVRRVNPSLTLAEPARVCFSDGLLRLAVGDGLIEKLLGPQRKEPRGGLLRFDLEPGKLADLRAAMKLLDDAPSPAAPRPYWYGYRRSRGEELDQLAAWLSSFARLRARASLGERGLRLEGEYAVR